MRAQRGHNLWQSDDRTALICGPREPMNPDPEDMEEEFFTRARKAGMSEQMARSTAN